MPSSGVQTCARSEEHTSELQSHDNLVCRLLLEKNILQSDPSATVLEGRRHQREARALGAPQVCGVVCSRGSAARADWGSYCSMFFFFLRGGPPPNCPPSPRPPPCRS